MKTTLVGIVQAIIPPPVPATMLQIAPLHHGILTIAQEMGTSVANVFLGILLTALAITLETALLIML